MSDFTDRPRYAAQLRSLAESAIAITSALDLGQRVELVAETARRIVGAHHVLVYLNARENDDGPIVVVSCSEKYDAGRSTPEALDLGRFVSIAAGAGQPLRLTQAEVDAHPAWWDLDVGVGSRPPIRGCLAAPLIGSRDEKLGWIQLSDRDEGEFTEEDEALIVQLARFAAGAVENARLYADAQQAVATRDRVLAVVSHDLRNPLNAISIIANLLLQPGLPEERRGEYAHTIKRSAEQMRAIIQDLLNFGMLESGRLTVQPTPHPAGRLLEEAAEGLQSQAAAKNVILEAIVEPDLPPVLADRERVLQVLSNLIGNAIRSSPDRGRVAARAERLLDRVRFSVTDEGPGIPTGQLPYVFELYWRASQPQPKDSGLALTVAKGIVKAHGGEIWVESKEGHGSTFFFNLPVAEIDPASSGERAVAQ